LNRSPIRLALAQNHPCIKCLFRLISWIHFWLIANQT
jgi:hypothetical protein